MRAHAAAISAQIFGHVHVDDFRVWGADGAAGVEGAPPLLELAAVSPIYRSNPAWYELRVGAAGVDGDVSPSRLTSITAHWTNLTHSAATSGAPSFREAYTTAGPFTNRAYARRAIRFLDERSPSADSGWRAFQTRFKAGVLGTRVCNGSSAAPLLRGAPRYAQIGPRSARDRPEVGPRSARGRRRARAGDVHLEECAVCERACRRVFVCLLLRGTDRAAFIECVEHGLVDRVVPTTPTPAARRRECASPSWDGLSITHSRWDECVAAPLVLVLGGVCLVAALVAVSAALMRRLGGLLGCPAASTHSSAAGGAMSK